MLTVFWKYVGLIIWPLNLSAVYDTTVYRSFLELPVLISLAGWLLPAALLFWKGSDQVRFWLCWFWLCLLPVSNIVPLTVYYADRYMYMPAVACFAVTALFVEQLITRGQQRQWNWVKSVLYGTTGIALCFYAVITYQRCGVWQNDLALWQDTVQKSPKMHTPHLNLGAAYERREMFTEAKREYYTAFRLDPQGKAAHNLQVLEMKIRLQRQR
ncbi:tetratricopeptide repeat protein [Thermodesulfobacteriota bacterium]